MAQPKSKSSDKTNVRRIKATDTEKAKTSKIKTKQSAKTSVKRSAQRTSKKVKETEIIEQETKNPFINLGRYFKGAWAELKLVRWPTRSATWALTAAVIIFTAIFAVFILLLDAGFKILFEQILR